MKKSAPTSNSDVAVGYIRVSPDENAKGRATLPMQEGKIRAYCEMRGLPLLGVVSDAGVSGADPLGERAGGAELLAMVASGQVGHVVMWKLDRGFRDCIDCLSVTRGWDEAGIAMHLVDLGGQTIDTRTGMGRFFLTMMAASAELERERTTAILAHKKAEGRRVGSIPLGMRMLTADEGDTRLVRDDVEALAIHEARQLRANGLSLRDIAGRLDALGSRPRGKAWHPQTIARMLAQVESAC